MTFEVFTRKNLRGSRNPTVTVTARGGLSLNGAAFEALGRPAFVQLLHDHDRRHLLGIRATQRNDDDAYRVNPRSRAFNAIEFVRYAGIATAADGIGGRRWDVTLDDGVLYWDSSQPGTEVTSNRAKKSA